jgi:hypothetical protein
MALCNGSCRVSRYSSRGCSAICPVQEEAAAEVADSALGSAAGDGIDGALSEDDSDAEEAIRTMVRCLCNVAPRRPAFLPSRTHTPLLMGTVFGGETFAKRPGHIT